MSSGQMSEPSCTRTSCARYSRKARQRLTGAWTWRMWTRCRAWFAGGVRPPNTSAQSVQEDLNARSWNNVSPKKLMDEPSNIDIEKEVRDSRAVRQPFTSYQAFVVTLLALLQFTVVLDFMILSPL